jgi:hypothetical protein
MDKQQRGMLLADKEEAEQKISKITDQLTSMGQILKDLGNAMFSRPEIIVFANAPSPLGDSPIDLINAPCFNWDKIPKIEDIAKLIQDLRREKRRLSDIERTLRPETF